ncbi:hypothetical protein CAOG_00249 [Capsaspora owczarzaki ATCC 30864]|uniref:Endonuclease/exonuclease/phosphatase domain-containing protein n=1 Tax=Capsaspora owczarzaki (strain ATCC 30864) TaxID=595528 RepID=A0A0D2WI80_CAPO3|nr:hypothetical protein CAOG_00249 [Capsaspora owczarzaki ATCC 30864]KJE88623.1 hypothetical protein CAOG_000249 [Capsaspora owczarzaki ATCC 30864]|eukprot:XP_004365120.1 hypothetical protein CAOG_00249 [Capsaspora owczarzaki ATCC 30864]
MPRLRILTWNISGLDISDASPPGETIATKLERLAFGMLDHDADILCLQEFPVPSDSRMPAHQKTFESLSKLFRELGWEFVNSAPSHCGWSCILVKQPWLERLELASTAGPAVFATFKVPRDDASGFGSSDDNAASSPPTITVASCHLAPFKTGTSQRSAQFQALAQAIKASQSTRSATNSIVIAGDFNARENENEHFAHDGYVDAFSAYCLLNPKERSQLQFTWDSTKNKYHADGFGFTCRFDRIVTKRAKVTSLKMIGNSPCVEADSSFYLSDHFGLVAEVQL